MSVTQDTHSTTRAISAMYAAGYSGQASYNRLYNAVISGKVPSEAGANGRPLVRTRDFPVIAAVLGLQAPAPSTSVQSV